MNTKLQGLVWVMFVDSGANPCIARIQRELDKLVDADTQGAWEVELAKLTPEELDLLAGGEQEAMKKLVQRAGLQDLDSFLESIFDGDLAPDFLRAVERPWPDV